jgi:hypothetical protein
LCHADIFFRAFEVPQALNGLPLATQLDALEEFWESEVPRIGEADAKGWSAWVTSDRPDYVPDTTSPAEVQPTFGSTSLPDPYCQWAKEELHADRSLNLLTRSTSGQDEDPYATVLFSDIRPLLVGLQTADAKKTFRLAWLSFLGLHIPGFCASLTIEGGDDRWSFTHLTRPFYFAAIFPNDAQRRKTVDAYAGVLVGREKEYAAGFGPVKNWGHGIVGPLENVEGKASWWAEEDVSSLCVSKMMPRLLFTQLRIGLDDYEWDVMALAFEAAISIKGWVFNNS